MCDDLQTPEQRFGRFVVFLRKVSYNVSVKYLPSLLGVGQLSGQAGNTVASRNRNGSYLRTRVTPVNPRTSLQSAVRASFASFATNWKALTDAQRGSWDALGAGTSRTDSLGSTYTLTGLQSYISVNRNLATIGSAAVTTAPANLPPLALTGLTVTATSV